MPQYKFTYFPLKAVGEPCRLLLAYGGQEFEDIRVKSDEWLKIKSSTPYGQLPLLEIDGKKYAQSIAISRYLGHKFGLGGATPEEDFEIDQIVDFIYDIKARAANVHYERDEAVKKAKHEEYTLSEYPDLLGKLNEIVGNNNGYVANGKLSWGDLVFGGMYDYLKVMINNPDLETKYPNLKKVADHVYALPQLKTYLANAPKTEF